MKAYTLKESKNTKERHLFEGEMTNTACTSKRISICKKMNSADSSRNLFACYDEKEARKECANIGRNVCGTCISHLYTTY